MISTKSKTQNKKQTSFLINCYSKSKCELKIIIEFQNIFN